ncbi:hypothetical protein ACFWC2_14415 [Streptomyces diastaticus]|uniref:hypothetical protein n=1 Tax=Streptomyces TaxID=1883 RepID=UPI002A819557|nr:hypothetical protein [Streptomyces sp. S399]WPR52812.1 hypothetical protein SJI45_18935 [Streptomyces sp. S399]
MSFLAGIGLFGLAAILTVILWFGSKENEGKVKLSWGWCLGLSLLAGTAYSAAGFPFDLIGSAINDVLGLIAAVAPDLKMPALAALMIALALFKKFTKRGISVLCIVWVHVATGAGGPYARVAAALADAAERLAA